MSSAIGRGSPRTRSLVALVFGALIVSAALVAAAQVRSDVAIAFDAPWLLLLTVALVVQLVPVTLHVHHAALQYVFSELPLVVGLFLFSPVEVVVARVAGQLLHEAVVRRFRLVKVLLNTASYALEAAVALALFWGLVGSAPLTRVMDTPTMVLTLVSVLAGTVIGGTVVWAAVDALGTRAVDLAGYVRALRLVLPISLVTASLALIAVLVIHEAPTAAWILLVPAIVLGLGYRTYLEERSQREVLGMLYRLAERTHGSPDLSAALGAVAAAVREHVEAGSVDLYVSRAPTGAWRLTADATGESGLDPVSQVPGTFERSLRSAQPVSEVDEHGRVLAITYAIDLGHDRAVGMIARDPVSEVDGFRAHAVTALQAVAPHARVAIEDAELREAKETFLSSVSHELRTPLSVVVAAAETLQAHRDRLTPDVVGLLTGRLHMQARRLDGLLRDLLDAERLGRGMFEPSWSRVDLGALVRRCVSALAIETHHITVRAPSVSARVDVSACERIVENLVLNAAKYSPAGSAIVVEVDALGGAVALSVTDHGEGIADPDKRRVFEPFTRLADDVPGTGIGLSLVKRLVEMHDGTIEVSDVPGGGTRFTVTLPQDREDRGAQAVDVRQGDLRQADAGGPTSGA